MRDRDVMLKFSTIIHTISVLIIYFIYIEALYGPACV